MSTIDPMAELEQMRRERDLARERVSVLRARLVAAQEDERARIARNLHDQLGQQLTALRLTLAALRDHECGRDDFRSRLEAIDKIAAHIDRDLEFITWELRPVALDEGGLHAALNAFVEEWSSTQHVPAKFHDSTSGSPRLVPEIESQLYRIVQEALNNVAKHAGARRVAVVLERRGDEVQLTIEDDGVGFNASIAADPSCRLNGLGLATMQERAALVGGAVQFESGPGKGTTLYVRIPVRTMPLLTP